MGVSTIIRLLRRDLGFVTFSARRLEMKLELELGEVDSVVSGGAIDWVAIDCGTTFVLDEVLASVVSLIGLTVNALSS